MLSLSFAIPPCSDGDSGNADSCCTPDVCPAIVKSKYTRKTGVFKYLNRVAIQTNVVLPGQGFMPYDLRSESIQIYDDYQEQAQQFINIVNAFDVLISPKPVFFPTDSVYNALTSPQQAAYTIDLKLYYKPSDWNRVGESRFIIFNDCIVTNAPTISLLNYNNYFSTVNNGVIKLAGGKGFEEDGYTILKGFAADGYTKISDQATLENFLHIKDTIDVNAKLSQTEQRLLSNIEYTFKPNIPTLAGKNLVTIGCDPSFDFSKKYINSMYVGDIVLKTAALRNLINGVGTTKVSATFSKPNVFPDPAAAQQCLTTALSALRSNLTEEGVAEFQATSIICLQKLKDDASSAVSSLIGLGFEPCESIFTIEPALQFTSKTIEIKVDDGIQDEEYPNEISICQTWLY